VRAGASSFGCDHVGGPRPAVRPAWLVKLAQDFELHFRFAGRDVLVTTGEIWPRVYLEVAFVDRTLAVAVCSEPAA
jgi:hypothetical protein